MVGPVPGGRSDDEFDRYVDALLAPDGALIWDDEDEVPAEHVAAAVAALGSLREPVDGDVAGRHLARLLADDPDVVDLAGRRRRRIVASSAAGLVLATTLLAGVGTAAAAGALPGDTLYGLKTARERIELSVARGGDGKASVHLRHAQARLDEAARLLRRGDVTDAVTALGRADAALAAAQAKGSDAIDERADDELARRVEVLGALLDGGLPTQAADAAREALARALARERGADSSPRSGGPGNAPATPGSGNRPSAPPTSPPADAPGQGNRPTANPGGSNRPAGPGKPTGRPAAPSHIPPGRPDTPPTPANR